MVDTPASPENLNVMSVVFLICVSGKKKQHVNVLTEKIKPAEAQSVSFANNASPA